MKFLVVLFAVLSAADSAALSGAPCKEWCGGFCLDSCRSTLATPICLGESQCRCLCPTTKADCKHDWCSNYCSTKAQDRKFEAQCDQNDQVCKCQFEQRFVPTQMRAKIQPTNITYVADSTLTAAEFKCTQQWCDSYCTSRGEGRKFQANCDETQSCHCQYEMKPLPSLASLSSNMRTSEFKCTHEWCSNFCESKSDGRKFEAECDEHQTCKCEYPRQSFIHASGGPDRSLKSGGDPSFVMRKFHCTHEWCATYCESKSNGRKFTAFCNELEACRCEYPWQPTGRRTVSTAFTSN